MHEAALLMKTILDAHMFGILWNLRMFACHNDMKLGELYLLDKLKIEAALSSLCHFIIQ